MFCGTCILKIFESKLLTFYRALSIFTAMRKLSAGPLSKTRWLYRQEVFRNLGAFLLKLTLCSRV